MTDYERAAWADDQQRLHEAAEDRRIDQAMQQGADDMISAYETAQYEQQDWPPEFYQG